MLSSDGRAEGFTHATTIGLDRTDVPPGEKGGQRFSGPSLHSHSPSVSFRVASLL